MVNMLVKMYDCGYIRLTTDRGHNKVPQDRTSEVHIVHISSAFVYGNTAVLMDPID